MRNKITAFLLTLSLGFSSGMFASDNGDGTFTNPVVWGDFPDPDVIRVDDTYYMISTSMFYFPGFTILQSKDLINWEIACNALSEYKEDKRYDLEGSYNGYARGQWATSLQYFKGKFHMLFTDLNCGSYIIHSEKITGPWTLQKLDNGYYDGGMYYNPEKDLIYVACGIGNIALKAMDPETFKFKAEISIFSGIDGLEGSRLYKIGDYYYNWCTVNLTFAQHCMRSKTLTKGPWEQKKIFQHCGNYVGHAIHQGPLVQATDGNWWTIMFREPGIGRIPHLLPVEFIDDWPMVAPNAKDGITTFNNPEPVLCNYKIATTDEFNEDTLNLQWQFNHNPVWNKFSFTEREGWLRLHTCNVTDSLYYAKNTITQRILGPISTATLKMDISNMKDGDVAGFSVFQWPYRSIAVVKEKDRKLLQIRVYDKPQEELTFNEDIIYLRAVVNAITEHFSFYYSFDNETFYSMGSDFATVFDLDHNFTGSRYAIFNYAEKETGGYVDIDWFRVDMKEGHYHTENAYEPVEAEYFTYNNKGEMAWGTERSDYKNQDVVYSSRRGYLGYHYIDFGDYAPESMTLSYSSTSLAQFKVNLNIRRDSSDGEIIGTAALGRSTSKTQETVALDKTKIADMKGIQKVYLEVESLRGDFKMDWFRFAADPLAVSAPERNKNRVWVYDGVLYMQGENVGNYNIYDVFGKLVASGYAEKGEVYVNDLPSGIYIIKNEKNVVGKFLK